MTDIGSAGIQLHRPGDKPTLFQKGHPRYGGRKKGSVNRFGGDLREAVVAGIAAVGAERIRDMHNVMPIAFPLPISVWRVDAVPYGIRRRRIIGSWERA